MSEKVYMYKRFERFWHWSQATLIFFLAFTGLEIHGLYTVLGYKNAVLSHNVAAFTLMALIAFAIFWHFTTGEWKQYVPTTEKLTDQMKFYILGIFKGEARPVKKSVTIKLNPLQRLTYVAYKIFLIPVMIVTGLVYYYVAHGDIVLKSVKVIATIHVFFALLLLAFAIVHVYMTTTGHSVTAHIKAMITGWDEVEPEDITEDKKDK